MNPAHAITRLLDYARRQMKIKTDPVGYARSLGVKVGHNVHFYGLTTGTFSSEPWLIEIGNNVHISPDCLFITHDGGTIILRGEVPDLELTAPITIGNDVYLGSRTIVLAGARIGNRCIIGAGSVVGGTIPPNSLAWGVPARVIRSTDAYLERAKASSLHLGHLFGEEKERALREFFNR